MATRLIPHTVFRYQLFSYLANRYPEKGPCEGILLYPTVDPELHAQFAILDFPITVRTLNLAQPWQGTSLLMTTSAAALRSSELVPLSISSIRKSTALPSWA